MNIILNVLHMILEGYPVIYPHGFYQVKPKLFIKVLTLVFSANWIPIIIQPILITPKPNIFHNNALFTPKGLLVPEKSLVFSFQAINDAQYLSSAGPVRIRSVYLIFLSIYNLDVISICSNTLTIRFRITLTTVGH